MAIAVNPNNLVSSHWVHVKTGDGFEQFVFTGVAIVHLGGARGDWRRDQVNFTIVIPERPGGKQLALKNWAPFVSINALGTIDDQGGDQFRGYAVDGFRILDPNKPAYTFVVQSDVAIRDVDSSLYRIGYNVTLVGSWVDEPELI